MEGPNLVSDAIGSGIVPDIVFATEVSDITERAITAGSELALVTDDVLQRVAGTKHPRGPVAVIAVPPPARVSQTHCLVLMDVADPGNVGTLIRVAAAFGLGTVVAGMSADPWSPKTLRAGAGGHFSTDIELVSDLDLAELRSRGISPVAAVARGGDPIRSLPLAHPLGVIIGSEANGLPPEIVEAADHRVTIPVEGIDSLNAAAAGAILAFVLRTKGSAGPRH